MVRKISLSSFRVLSSFLLWVSFSRRYFISQKRRNSVFRGAGGCGKAGRFATSKKKGDFFRLIWAEIFLHKSLTDSGISHRFFLFTQLLTDSNIYTSVEYFYTGVVRKGGHKVRLW
jgi:hypothetical protein